MHRRKLLARPPLHFLTAAILFGLFHAPLLGTGSTPTGILLRMFGVWAVAIGVLALVPLSDDREQEE